MATLSMDLCPMAGHAPRTGGCRTQHKETSHGIQSTRLPAGGHGVRGQYGPGSGLAHRLGAGPRCLSLQATAHGDPLSGRGGTDIIGRIIAQQLSQAWGQPVVVENRPGSSGIIGNDVVAKSAPDGHTLLLGITAMIQSPALYPKLPYDVLRDFAPVSQVALSSDLLVVPREVPAATLKEFIALVKAHPGKYSNGNYGNGTSSHMHGELLRAKAGWTWR